MINKIQILNAYLLFLLYIYIYAIIFKKIRRKCIDKKFLI